MPNKKNWVDYQKITESAPPNKSLVEAVEYATNKTVALDLGAGSLRDTKFLLEQGFDRVEIVDIEPTVKDRVTETMADNVSVTISSFEDNNYPSNKFDLINAHWSIFFIRSEIFETIFQKISESLKSGGIFVGQLLGKDDDWIKAGKDYKPYNLEGINDLFNDFKILDIKEVNEDGKVANGNPKHWHLFHIIARKK